MCGLSEELSDVLMTCELGGAGMPLQDFRCANTNVVWTRSLCPGGPGLLRILMFSTLKTLIPCGTLIPDTTNWIMAYIVAFKLASLAIFSALYLGPPWGSGYVFSIIPPTKKKLVC